MALAWKYAYVDRIVLGMIHMETDMTSMTFGILLGVTILAGFIKVLYDRNKYRPPSKLTESTTNIFS
jgi:hypothetical protein